MMGGGRGLPCRADGCRAMFSRVGDGESMARFREAIADRDAHELERHQLIVGTGSARGQRRRPSVGRHAGEIVDDSMKRRRGRPTYIGAIPSSAELGLRDTSGDLNRSVLRRRSRAELDAMREAEDRLRSATETA